MMKVMDARQKIIMRKLQRTSPKSLKLTDARELLKQKRRQAFMKSTKNETTPSPFRNDSFRRQSALSARPFANFRRKNEMKNITTSGKKVSLKDGMITVTARQRVTGHSSPKTVNPAGKQIVATDAGITVVKMNTRSSQTPLTATREESMDGDMDEPLLYEYHRPRRSPSTEYHKHTPSKVDLRSSISRQQFATSKPVYPESSQIQQTPVLSPRIPQSSSVLVTNLHPSVSEDDILELFSDIGAIRSTQFLQPGTAVIYYLRKTDAEKACLAYHNRLLDGLPMRCTILPESGIGKMSLLSKPGMHESYVNPTSLEAEPMDVGRPLHSGSSQYSSRVLQKPVKFTVRLP